MTVPKEMHRTIGRPGCCGPRGSQTEFAQAGVIVGTTAQGPVEQAVGLSNRQIVDTGVTHRHQALRIEFPIFVAVGTEPVLSIVVPLIGETHRNAVVRERPQFLDETVVEFSRPFTREQADNSVRGQ